jgi:hypothetical protein
MNPYRLAITSTVDDRCLERVVLDLRAASFWSGPLSIQRGRCPYSWQSKPSSAHLRQDGRVSSHFFLRRRQVQHPFVLLQPTECQQGQDWTIATITRGLGSSLIAGIAKQSQYTRTKTKSDLHFQRSLGFETNVGISRLKCITVCKAPLLAYAPCSSAQSVACYSLPVLAALVWWQPSTVSANYYMFFA